MFLTYMPTFIGVYSLFLKTKKEQRHTVPLKEMKLFCFLEHNTSPSI